MEGRPLAQKILIVQPLPGIGDVVWFLPHMQAIHQRFPEAKLSLLTKPSSCADQVLASTLPLQNILWMKNPHNPLGRLVTFFRMVHKIKRERFDAIWILHKSPRYALMAKLAGISKIYGYGTSYGRLLSTPPFLTLKEHTYHPIEKATSFLAHHDIILPKETYLSVDLHAEAKVKERFTPTNKRIILGIGGSEVYKKWPDFFFTDLAEQLYKKGYEICILGGAQEAREADLVARMTEEKGAKALPVTDLSIQEAMAFIQTAILFVGNDTGMLNVAAALNIPSVGLFAKTAPLSYRSNLHPLAPNNSDASISDISVDQAMEKALTLL